MRHLNLRNISVLLVILAFISSYKVLPSYAETAYELERYGGFYGSTTPIQDKDPDDFSIEDDGLTLHLYGNTWKSISFN